MTETIFTKKKPGASAEPDLSKTRRAKKALPARPVAADRTAPHDDKAEVGVLGCVFLNPKEVLSDCASLLKDGGQEFYDLRHQSIYVAAMELFNSGEEVDVITMQNLLKKRGELDQVGGIAYLASLPDAVSSAANLSYYIEIVRENFLLRRVIAVCADAAERAYSCKGNVATLLDEFERDALALAPSSCSDTKGSVQLVRSTIDYVEAAIARGGAIGGLPTGFADLDELLDGLNPGEVYIVAGFTSGGKTAFAMNVVENVLLNCSLPVGVFSLEMSAESLMNRMLCSAAKVNLREVRRGRVDEESMQRIFTTTSRLAKTKLYVNDTSDMSVRQIRAEGRRMVQRHGVRLLVVDYLQLAQPDSDSRKNESREQEVSGISRGLKAMARELKVPVLALSQLNDDGKLRESRGIGQDADVVIKLRPKTDDSARRGKDGAAPPAEPAGDAWPVQLVVEKQRNGATDVVELVFLKKHTRFESVSRASEPDGYQ